MLPIVIAGEAFTITESVNIEEVHPVIELPTVSVKYRVPDEAALLRFTVIEDGLTASEPFVTEVIPLPDTLY